MYIDAELTVELRKGGTVGVLRKGDFRSVLTKIVIIKYVRVSWPFV